MSPREGGGELTVEGPFRATGTIVDELNRVFSDAFTERYHRDGMGGVRVPMLNPAVWRYALAAADDGGLCWKDETGQLAAFNMVHASGREGWMGPLAVRPDCQGFGIGRTIVTAGIAMLKRKGCRSIGLETMPRTIDNIGFYSGLGFRPGHLTISMSREVSSGDRPSAELASAVGSMDQWLPWCGALTDRVVPGLDFTREIAVTYNDRLGDLTLVRRDGSLRGFALWHGVSLAAGRSPDEIRVLKLVAADLPVFGELVCGVVAEASRRGLRRVAVRCQTAYRDAYASLLSIGFRVHWTDLRMVLDGYDERAPTSGVVFSNWEI